MEFLRKKKKIPTIENIYAIILFHVNVMSICICCSAFLLIEMNVQFPKKKKNIMSICDTCTPRELRSGKGQIWDDLKVCKQSFKAKYHTYQSYKCL